MNLYLILILIILIGSYAITLVIEYLNIRHITPDLPEEFKTIYDEEKYKKSQEYLKEKTGFGLFQETLDVILMLIVILGGFLNIFDLWIRGLGFGSIITGILFIFLLGFLLQIIHLPFAIYDTFYIEKKYGFNKTTVKTFILDLIKGLILSIIIGSIVLAFILFFFEKLGALAWLIAWAFVSVVQLFLMIIAPIWIMPLFNKFIPLEEGELKTEIETYAKENQFALKGIFKMDGSKRSTKSNAFFTGLGKFRRVVLFDTLIEKHTTEELVSVLAHEIGHYKKKHIYKMMGLSILTTGLTFWVLSLFLNNVSLFAAFKLEHLSIYAGLVIFGFVFAPIEMILGILGNILSRHQEYEADAFAIKTYKKPEIFIDALKKLSVDNLSNLTPHPLKVFLEYSHPPILKRIEAIRKVCIKDEIFGLRKKHYRKMTVEQQLKNLRKGRKF